MKVDVLDDKKSLIHLAVGFLTIFTITFFVIFVFYELAEFIYKNRKGCEESVENFIGDLLEYFMGLGFATLLQKSVFC